MTDRDIKPDNLIATPHNDNGVPALHPRRRRRPRLGCGSGSSAPSCWGSVIHGPKGCTCPHGPLRDEPKSRPITREP